MTKLAMLNLWKEGFVPHIQIHDELDYSIFNDEQAKTVVEKMVSCVDLAVPLTVDSEFGKTWGDAE